MRTLTEAAERARNGRWVEDFTDTFTNELGRKITIQVSEQGWNVRIAIIGPDSTFESIVTPREAIVLQRGLNSALATRFSQSGGTK